MKVILGMGKMQAKKSENPSLQKTAEKAADLADISLKEMSNVLNNLKPEALEKGGLKAGLSAMTENLDQIDVYKRQEMRQAVIDILAENLESWLTGGMKNRVD